MVAPPAVPSDRLTGWRRASDGTETPFSAAGVTATARILVYEDDALREAIKRRTGIDRSWRFFLAARLELAPSPPISGALRRLIVDRAGRGFVDRLEDRGFVGVDRTERRSLRVGDDDARLLRYDARCRVGGVTLSVDSWLAVWAPDDTFRLAGGAYPTDVVDMDDTDSAVDLADALRDRIDPSAFRSALLALIRQTR